MTAILVDGFDLYNGAGLNTGLQAKWTATNSTTVWSMVTGRFGDQAVRNAGGLSGLERSMRRTFTAVSSGTVGFAFRQVTMGASGTTEHMLHLKNGSTYQIGLSITDTGVISAGRYTAVNSVTALATSASGVIVANTWHYIELEFVISDTVGRVTIYVDGVNVASASSADTLNSGATVDTVQIGGMANSNVWANADYDDLYVSDSSTRLGEQRVETLRPSADVAQGFARSTGSTNYTLVNENQTDGDSSYVQGSSVGDVDTYDLGDLSSTPTAINGVQLSAFAEKTDAGSRSIALQAKSGATTSDGSNFALAASYGKFERLLTTDPATSSAWAASAVNALRCGPKVTV